MAKVRIKWHPGAFRQVRTMPEVLDILDSYAAAVAARAGEGYEAEPAQATGGRGRGRAAVVTATVEAMHDEATRHTLEGSL